MAQILLGERSCELLHPVLRRHEIAFVARLSERQVRNLLRRGERLQLLGLSAEEVAARGALAVSMAGRARGASPTAVANLPRVGENPLAMAMLRAIVAGRLRAPRAAGPNDLPPALTERLHLL